MEAKIAGSYTLVSFKIFPLTTDRTNASGDPRRGIFSTGSTNSRSEAVEFKQIVHAWSITESIRSGAVRGSATVYDSVGAFYKVPLTGQEVLEITYRDTKDVELTEKFLIYAITDLKPAKNADDSTLEYKINFVSFGKFWSDRYDVRRCIANGSGISRSYPEIHEQVQVLFDDYYSSPGGTTKPITISKTEGPVQIVIPNMKPEDAMHLLSRKSYNSEYNMQQYRFFENRGGYYFVNMEEHITFGRDGANPQLFFYTSGPADNSAEGEYVKLQNIISLDYGDFVNTIDYLNQGAYYREYVEMNIAQRTLDVTGYEYLDEIGGYQYPDINLPMKTIHSEEMIREHLNKTHYTYGIKDYGEGSASPARHYRDIYNHRGATFYHYKENAITARVYGTNELFAGDVVTLENIPRFGADYNQGEPDRGRIGKYLVESIQNDFYENTYTQTLTLTKGGLLETGNTP